jgi:hypothetical protein
MANEYRKGSMQLHYVFAPQIYYLLFWMLKINISIHIYYLLYYIHI